MSDCCGTGTCCEPAPVIQLGTPNVPRSRRFKVYTNEFNCVMGAYRYLPFVSGILRAYAETFPEIRDAFEFQPFLYEMAPVEEILKHYDDPAVAAFSVSMWNEQLNFAVAREVKRRWPKCLVVFGGVQVPNRPEQYMWDNPFIDLCVFGEGEEAFIDILRRYIDGTRDDYTGIPGVCSYPLAFERPSEPVACYTPRPFAKDMSVYPSPYTGGLFDDLLAGQTERRQFQAIIETNRGCLAADTEVMTPAGPKKITEVNVHDSVLGWDEVGNKPVWNSVGGVLYTGEQVTVNVEVQWYDEYWDPYGRWFLEATPDHRLLGQEGGWTEAERLNGRYVLCLDGVGLNGKAHWCRALVDDRGVKSKVYDLANLAPWPNFFANGVLVHNCSFPCSFCAWGRGGLTTKYRFRDLGQVKEDITYLGRNRTPYIFNADANFAMHPRDYEICEHLVRVKQEHGFPLKFRTCWGKNTDEKIYRAATLLHRADMEKGVTLARQSNDPVTLKNIRRDNIKLETYRNLQQRFTEQGVPVYIELILGLPGETVESWKAGIDDVLTTAGPMTSLFVYLCQILTNTEMADPSYQARHGIKTRRIELQEIHGSPRGPGFVVEYEDVVVETAAMSVADWRTLCKFSWLTMFFHSMKAGFFVLAWLWDRSKTPPSEFVAWCLRKAGGGTFLRDEFDRWDRLLDGMLERGAGRGQILPEYGPIYWDVEEAALLRASEYWPQFYAELAELLYGFLGVVETDELTEIDEVLLYQQDRMPSFANEIARRWEGRPRIELPFKAAVPEYFDRLLTPDAGPLKLKHQKLIIRPRAWESKEQFARESVLWARKSGTMLTPCEWEDAS